MSAPRSPCMVLESVTVLTGALLVAGVLAWLDGHATERLGGHMLLVVARKP